MERIVERVSEDQREHEQEVPLRPSTFSEFPGQEALKKKLEIFVSAAKKRQEALDHVLLSGPPGLGKTTLARIIANTMGVPFKGTSGPALEKKGELAALLTNMEKHTVVFIDEIHRMSRSLEEFLYSAMEDYFIDVVAGEGLAARTVRFNIQPFTLIGATTRSGLLNTPFLHRFGIQERLSFYSVDSLQAILLRAASILKVSIDPGGAREIAKRSRGTPRIANRLLKRVRDFAHASNSEHITQRVAEEGLTQLQVDSLGLDEMDRQILKLIDEKFGGGPVGIDTLAAALSEDKGTIEEVYEPYLIQQGFLLKTPRGRVLSQTARDHLFDLV